MEADFWHQKWAEKKIGFHQPSINALLLKYWPSFGVEQGQSVFVPLCGKSLDMRYLAEQGYEVIGNELSEQAVEDFFAENHLPVDKLLTGQHQRYLTANISIYQGDYFSLQAEAFSQVTAFYDRAALIAWPESMRASYVQQLASLLPSGSVGLLVTLDYPQSALMGPPFAVSDDWILANMSDDFEIELLESTSVLNDNPRFLNKQVPWLTESAYRLVRR